MGRSDRSDPGDEPDVDFVVGEPGAGPRDDGDEDLPQPDADGPKARRLRVDLGLGAAALLVALLIARAATHSSHETGSGTPTDAPPSSTPVSTPTGPVTPPPYLYRGNLPPQHTGRSTAVVVVPEHVPERRGADPAACPGLRCTTSTTLPAPVSDAIQAAFPESTVEHTETVRLRGHGHVLWYREVDVRAGSEELILRVQAPARGDRPRSGHSTAPDGRQTTYLSTAYGPWFVEVEVLDYLGGQASTTLMSRLAEDPRIVA